jgi:predicted CXXCH cytochrome family protein
MPLGPAHSAGAARAPLQAIEGENPHAVVRETTASSYCVACHVGFDDPQTNHPVGISLAEVAAQHPGQYLNPPADPAVVLVNGSTIECSSCHDDGSAGYPSLTVLDGFMLCIACHNL